MKALWRIHEQTAFRNERAFSLVELLVVIVLVAMMAALLLPALDKAKQQSLAAACLSNQKQLASAMHMYAEDNSDHLVPMSDYETGANIYPGGGFWGGPIPDVSLWNNQEIALTAVETGLETSNALYFYCENVNVFHCPGDPRTQHFPTLKDPNGWGYDSYSRTQNTGGEPYDNYWGAGATYKKMSDILRPSSTLSMMERSDWRGYNVGTWVVRWQKNGFQWLEPPSFWHLKVSSSGFVDGHGELHKWSDPALVAAGRQAAQGLDTADWCGPTNGPDYQFVYDCYLFPGHP